jgi:hypothetical protein
MRLFEGEEMQVCIFSEIPVTQEKISIIVFNMFLFKEKLGFKYFSIFETVTAGSSGSMVARITSHICNGRSHQFLYCI